LKRVESILASLESGGGFNLASDALSDKELLESKIDALRAKVRSLHFEEEALENDEVFAIVESVDDWDGYFDKVRLQLTEEYDALVNG